MSAWRESNDARRAVLGEHYTFPLLGEWWRGDLGVTATVGRCQLHDDHVMVLHWTRQPGVEEANAFLDGPWIEAAVRFAPYDARVGNLLTPPCLSSFTGPVDDDGFYAPVSLIHWCERAGL